MVLFGTVAIGYGQANVSMRPIPYGTDADKTAPETTDKQVCKKKE